MEKINISQMGGQKMEKVPGYQSQEEALESQLRALQNPELLNALERIPDENARKQKILSRNEQIEEIKRRIKSIKIQKGQERGHA